MKICFVSTGDIKYISTMKRALGMTKPLVACGWSVVIIAQDTEENRKRIKLEASSAETYYFKSGNPMREVIIKNDLLRKIKPDIVWVCALVLRNFILNGHYKILIDHSELASHIVSEKWYKKWLLRWLEFYSTKYDGLICASRYLENYYNQRTLIPVLYLPYAYNQEVMGASSEKIETLKHEKGSSFIFMYMGSFIQDYGLYTMLEAIREFASYEYDFKFYMLGRGKLYEKTCDFVRINNLENRVIVVGYVEENELNAYFLMADAFVSPLNDTVQDWARCPSKIYMYIPYRKPILTCKIGEPAYIWGEQGYYFENDDPSSLLRLMEYVMCENRTVMDLDISLFNWDSRVRKFIGWYNEIYR